MLGGAIAHYGLNFPSLITAVVEAVGGLLVYWNLTESPKFTELKRRGQISVHEDRSPSVKGLRDGTIPSRSAKTRVFLICSASMFTTMCSIRHAWGVGEALAGGGREGSRNEMFLSTKLYFRNQ